ncbi:MAG: MarR family winged helix-turn-helix transcriptional regulator [Roseburia sp.]|nr:MarR family winged helix-turn-helix transcriptional regulator [Roseburia sp.]
MTGRRKGGVMEREEEPMICFRIKSVNNLIRRKLDVRFAQAGIGDLSGIQGPVVGFIYQHSRKRDIFQKDIEQEFSIQRSTATVLLQNLEQKGMITRVAVSHDGRMKKILLTDKAVQCHQRIKEQLDIFNGELEAGISPAEREALFCILDKLQENLSGL